MGTRSRCHLHVYFVRRFEPESILNVLEERVMVFSGQVSALVCYQMLGGIVSKETVCCVVLIFLVAGHLGL